ncbi:MAG: helix-turn-helix domain-containing protein [Acidimicrobiia bacterium]
MGRRRQSAPSTAIREGGSCEPADDGLRALSEARGLSQRNLAERVGTTHSAIARLEGGQISEPSDAVQDRRGARGRAEREPRRFERQLMSGPVSNELSNEQAST